MTAAVWDSCPCVTGGRRRHSAFSFSERKERLFYLSLFYIEFAALCDHGWAFLPHSWKGHHKISIQHVCLECPAVWKVLPFQGRFIGLIMRSREWGITLQKWEEFSLQVWSWWEPIPAFAGSASPGISDCKSTLTCNSSCHSGVVCGEGGNFNLCFIFFLF